MQKIETDDAYQAALAELEAILDNTDDESNARIEELAAVISDYEERMDFMGNGVI
jgi:predicted metal-dependent enzyme (double-stranded beta helix superfamily)